ncbi:26S proteasome regulatory subunit N1 [Nematocida minor]|uniref:26S proteasome regulatory subunit N1 n=1 Tax=Nematocida minor TaxID=1912983 RepID=UPI002220FA6B|nr:26S proteasome regulatory subunit N1 [Nematocida minor]KAI5192774.1 26S proteasome regulatory subunit N1 [Nematocida minor]
MDSKTDEIHVIMDSLKDSDPDITHSALSMLVQKLRSSTSVASTIPKMLIYLVSQKDILHEKLLTLQGENKLLMADVMSVISATLPNTDSLKYRIQGGSTPLDIWGHQYIKKLASDIIKVIKKELPQSTENSKSADASSQIGNNNDISALESEENEEMVATIQDSLSTIDGILGTDPHPSSDSDVVDKDDLSDNRKEDSATTSRIHAQGYNVVYDVISCLFKFNCECECIDLLLEIDRLQYIHHFIDSDNLERAVNYLLSLSFYVRSSRIPDALQVILLKSSKIEEYAILMIKNRKIKELLKVYATRTEIEKIKIVHTLAKHEAWNYVTKEEWDSFMSSNTAYAAVLNNTYTAVLNKYVSDKLELSKDKVSTEEYGSFSDALSKVSFSNETIAEPENKKTYKITTQCSKGLLFMWDQNKALIELEDNLFCEDGYLRVSSILALSAATCRVYDDNDTVLAAVEEGMNTKSVTQKIVLMISLVLKYASSNRPDIFEIIQKMLYDESIEVCLFAVYAAGCIFSGSCNTEVYTEVLNVLASRIGDDSDNVVTNGSINGNISSNGNNIVRFALLGVSLIFLQGTDAVYSVIESAEVLGTYATALSILMRSMAYLGTGDTDVIHDILKDALDISENASEEAEATENGNIYDTFDYKTVFSILGVALISMGDDTSVQMAAHILEGSSLLDIPRAHMAIPLAYSLLYMSSGRTDIIDKLRRCICSSDLSVIVSAVVSLGTIAAGSNNSRVISILDDISSVCGKGASGSVIKIAYGLVRMGHGLFGLSVMRDGVISSKSVACFMGFLFGAMDGGISVLDRYYFILMLISASIHPKYLIGVNAEGVPVDVNIRVGGRVDITGVAGSPRKLSGAQVHASPIILQPQEAAEILTETDMFRTGEGVVVVQEKEKEKEKEDSK